MEQRLYAVRFLRQRRFTVVATKTGLLSIFSSTVGAGFPCCCPRKHLFVTQSVKNDKNDVFFSFVISASL
jgi:hypothetical protein